VILPAVTRKRVVGLLVIMSAVAALFLLERIIVTERERIVAVIEDLCASAERADAAAMLERVSSDFSSRTLSREQLRSLAMAFFEHYGPVRVRIVEMGLNRIGDRAVVLLRISTRAQDAVRRELLGISEWDLELRKEPDGAWRITGIVPLQIGRTAVSGWPHALDMDGF